MVDDNEILYKEALKFAKVYIKTTLDEEDGEYSELEKQYIELREVAKVFMPENLFRRLINKQNKNRNFTI
jgi:hypothetical protein